MRDQAVTDRVSERPAQRAVDVVHSLRGQPSIVAADTAGFSELGVQALDPLAGQRLDRQFADAGDDVAPHVHFTRVVSTWPQARLGRRQPVLEESLHGEPGRRDVSALRQGGLELVHRHQGLTLGREPGLAPLLTRCARGARSIPKPQQYRSWPQCGQRRAFPCSVAPQRLHRL